MENDIPESGTSYTDNFIIKDVLGEGGIGRVFLAFEKDIGREVAIKELLPKKLGQHKDRAIARFIREAKLSGKLQHPSIVPVYEMGTRPDGTPFYVMKYVEGENLNHMIKECTLGSLESSFRRRIRFLDNLIAIAEAVGYAHAHGIIHRDLKPHNIVIGKFGETIILDWGLAKQLWDKEIEKTETSSSEEQEEADDTKTRQGAILGTPSYMPPEQVDAKFGEVDTRSDVYALGCILFMILTGDKPYRGDPKRAMELIVSDNPSPSPRIYGKFIPPELTAICEKAMDKEKKNRFFNAFEFASELRAYRDGRLLSIYAYSRKELFKRFVTRNKAAIIAACAIMVSIIIGAAFSLNFALDAHRARGVAEQALVDITNLSESSMALSQNITNELDNYFNNLAHKFKSETNAMAELNLADNLVIGPHLKKLSEYYPEAASFVVTNATGTVTASLPKIYRVGTQFPFTDFNKLKKILRSQGFAISDVYTTEFDQRVFTIQAPIYRNAQIAGILNGLIKIDSILPSKFSINPLSSDYQVWCMQKDGKILYDEDPKQIGKKLFTDEIYTRFPELQKFGKQIQKESWGVGHYSFTMKDKSLTTYKVAAWDTLEDPVDWKIVVTHLYSIKK